MLDACRRIAEVRPNVRCPTGEARITPGFCLPARFVIHTVGPVWHGGGNGEQELLAAAYRNAMAIAVDHGFRTVAFPAISTGIYGYPLDAAASIAVREIGAVLAHSPIVESVLLVAFGDEVEASLVRALAAG